jgi:uncharacterized protein (TIRG00374 family)
MSQPSQLARGLGGALLMNLSYVCAMYASVRAFGGNVPFAAVAVVYLAGQALGSVAPTPGGLGAIEAALTAGLTGIGLPSSIAVSAVLLFRLVTFWFPVAPGYLCFGYLQRRNAI